MESSFLICIVVAFLVPLIFKSLVKEVTIKDEYKTIFETNTRRTLKFFYKLKLLNKVYINENNNYYYNKLK